MHEKPLARWGIFLLPIAVGLFFRAETSAHGDSSFYRIMPRSLLEMGAVPLQPWEWTHSGHHVVVAPFLFLQQMLGGGDDPMFLCQLLNYVLHGALALTVYEVLRLRRPSEARGAEFVVGVAVASLPGWLWCSQMPLSDVSGNALVLIAALRCLQHESHSLSGVELVSAWTERLRLYAGYAWTGLLIGMAILFRLSALGFGPLLLFLSLRVLVATPRGRRLGKSLAVVLGLVLPIALLFGHWIATMGWDAFLQVYLRSGGDNSGFRVGFLELLPRWLGHWSLGLGPVLIVASVCGLLIATVRGVLRPGRGLLRGEAGLILAGIVGLLPYLVLVAHNAGWAEFRYQVPILLVATTWTCFLIVPLVRRWGRVTTWALGGVLFVGNAFQAYPMLHVLDRRQGFLESGTLELARRSPPDAAIPTHYSLGFVQIHGEDRWWIPLEEERPGRPLHHTYLPAPLAAELLLIAHLEGHEIWMMNDPTLDGVRLWLRERGWREEEMWRRDFSGLRHHSDHILSSMRVAAALEPHPLRLLRLSPPADRKPSIRHEVEAVRESNSMQLRVRIEAPGLEGWRFRFLCGTEPLARPKRVNMPAVRMPFAFDDPLYQASLFAVEEAPPEERATVDGVIDAEGGAETLLPPDWSEAVSGAWSTVLLYEEEDWPLEARMRTRVRPPVEK